MDRNSRRQSVEIVVVLIAGLIFGACVIAIDYLERAVTIQAQQAAYWKAEAQKLRGKCGE